MLDAERFPDDFMFQLAAEGKFEVVANCDYLARLKGISKNPDFISTAVLQKKFLAYISSICGAAKFFASRRYAACLLTPLPRLAFERTLNF